MRNDNEKTIPTPEDLFKTLEAAQIAVMEFSAGQRWAGHRAYGDSESEWREHVASQLAALDKVTAAHSALLGGLAMLVAAQAEQTKSSGISVKLKALAGFIADPSKLNALVDVGIKLLDLKAKLLGK